MLTPELALRLEKREQAGPHLCGTIRSSLKIACLHLLQNFYKTQTTPCRPAS
jgi:hypothetical protein